jgi:hypothetical protein
VNNQQFQAFNNNLQVQPPPIFQAGLAEGQSALNAYNARQAGIGNWLNAGSRVAAAYPWSS